jgi:hypothetical protein
MSGTPTHNAATNRLNNVIKDGFICPPKGDLMHDANEHTVENEVFM